MVYAVVMGCLCGPGVAAADTMDRGMTDSNMMPSLEKLGRGVSNLLGGWLEIPATIQQRHTTRDTAGSLASGAFIGLFRGIGRTVVGAYETLTFWLPLPEDFAPILPTLPYFNTADPRPALPLE
jgi:putative exosortase-associated protein (TIGR04073 family)